MTAAPASQCCSSDIVTADVIVVDVVHGISGEFIARASCHASGTVRALCRIVAIQASAPGPWRVVSADGHALDPGTPLTVAGITHGSQVAVVRTIVRDVLQGLPRSHSDWWLPETYEVKRTICFSAHGRFLEAQDLETGEFVAIRRESQVFENPLRAAQLLRDVAILRRLAHPLHVVELRDLFLLIPCSSPLGELCIATELCESDLRKLVLSDIMLTDMHVKALFYNLITALRYIHSAGVYHRNLRPEHCLLNEDCTLKLSHFGAAALRQHRGWPACNDALGPFRAAAAAMRMPSSQRRRREATGPWALYAAPEILVPRLQRASDGQEDVWSAGCVLADLISALGKKKARGPITAVLLGSRQLGCFWSFWFLRGQHRAV